MFNKTKRKAIDVEAVQWDGTDEGATDILTALESKAEYYSNTKELRVQGAQDFWLTVKPEDWIVKNNTIAVFAPAEFESEFEEVKEPKKKDKGEHKEERHGYNH